MKIYSTSDVHSCVAALEKAIEKVDLEDENSMLVLLGDYCDREPDSLGVYRTIMGLQEQYGGRVIASR